VHLNTEIKKYDQELQQLIGDSIRMVTYYEIDYGEPSYDCGDYHSLDYGLQIELTSGDSFYVIWDSLFCQHDLKVKIGNIRQELKTPFDGISEYPLVDNKKWDPLLNQKIASVKSYWSYYQYQGENKKHFFPQDLELIFENDKRVYFSAIEITKKDVVVPFADHITVIFDRAIADQYQIGIEENLS